MQDLCFAISCTTGATRHKRRFENINKYKTYDSKDESLTLGLTARLEHTDAQSDKLTVKSTPVSHILTGGRSRG